MFLLVMPEYEGLKKIHVWEYPEVGEKKAQKKKIVGENNGQLHFRPPPRVSHASRLDQKKEKKSVKTMASFASTEATWTKLIEFGCFEAEKRLGIVCGWSSQENKDYANLC